MSGHFVLKVSECQKENFQVILTAQTDPGVIIQCQNMMNLSVWEMHIKIQHRKIHLATPNQQPPH